jgi:predicted RNase H-like nuclease (RuvC/YqgF family)
MYSIDIKNNKEIYDYCMHNGITDINKFVQDCFKQGYDIKKYGLLGETLNEGEKDLKTGSIGEKQVIKEVIVEKRVEIPVEVIKEVEKIVEVIKEVEKIVEVPVEKVVTKIEYISDKSSENELGEKIAKLEEEMSKKDEELAEFRRSLDISKQNDKTKLLQETLQKLRKEISEKNEKIENLEKINQELQNTKQPLKGFFMKGSNINDTL